MSLKLILFSDKDIAGKNIGKILIENFGFKELGEKRHKKDDILLIEIEGEILNLEKIEIKGEKENFEPSPEICIVASRHSSVSGRPSLTTHSPGNFSIAEFGGEDRELAIAPALYLRETLISLQRNAKNFLLDDYYEISLEVTHHGPTQLNFPILFVEIGSTKKEWNDQKACEIVATTIHDVLTKEPEKVLSAVGFGGGHYCKKFSKLIEKVALGHICPKYNLPNIDDEMLKKMILKTIPEPSYALLEKKGMSSEERKKILDIMMLKKISKELEIKFV